ncbi:hypothetical protein BKA70DRAFT_1398186 [Coprinopsis sp. MPI-PUGE-AT-0042]|nr:hypothetical protein BKA70DRAFT_1398186 [Coprinopsis sp. MPI-PUGE-AT-0042]
MVQLSLLRVSYVLALGAALVSSAPVPRKDLMSRHSEAVNRRHVAEAVDVAVVAPPTSSTPEAKLTIRAETVAENVVRSLNSVSRRQSSFIFPELPFSQFQISSTPGGIAAEEAAAQFIAPFNGVDLATVSEDVETALANMREEAEAAELDLFNPAIDAASGADAAALQVGKTKNKVLKHTIFLQLLNIKLAKAQAEGKDTSKIEADLAARQKKLDTNTALDQENRGQTSKSVV